MNIEDLTGSVNWETTAKLYEEMLKDAYERIEKLEAAVEYAIHNFIEKD